MISTHLEYYSLRINYTKNGNFLQDNNIIIMQRAFSYGNIIVLVMVFIYHIYFNIIILTE